MAAGVSQVSEIGWSGGWEKQRAAVRTLVVLSATVRFQGRGHVGLIRDISREGLFVYSDFVPSVGESLQIEIRDRHNSSADVWCAGKVVRVESKAKGAAVGIALKITAYATQHNAAADAD